MSDLAEQLIQQALGLPADERAQLAERLLTSLETASPEIDRAWALEAEDRIDAFERGEIEGIPAEDVFRAIEHRKR